MPKSAVVHLVLAASLSAALSARASSPLLTGELDGIVSAAAKTGPGQEPVAFRKLEQEERAAMGNPKRRAAVEAALIRLLDEGTTYEAKSFACKQLAFMGSDNAVPPLAHLLGDKATCPAACIALGGIATPKAKGALRQALDRDDCSDPVQLIDTLGDLQDAKATGLLGRFASGPSGDAKLAAIAALAKVGTRQACDAVEKVGGAASPDVVSAMDNALLRFADQFAKEGDRRRAMRIYEKLLKDNTSLNLKRAALEGSLRLEPDGGQKRTLQILEDSDVALNPVAIQWVRSLPEGSDVARIVETLRGLPSDQQEMLIDSLAGRPEPAAKAAVEKALFDANPSVRSAGVSALAHFGGAEDVPLLCAAIARRPTPDEARGLQSALSSLPGGTQTDAALASALTNSVPEARPYLLSALAERKGAAVNQLLLRYCHDASQPVREAALKGLTRTATSNEAGELLDVLQGAPDARTRSGARAACERALLQVPTPGERLVVLKKSINASVGGESMAATIGLLTVCGNDEALQLLKTSLHSGNSLVRESAIETAADWPNMGAWDTLYEVFSTSEQAQERANALRGLVRLLDAGNAAPDSHQMERYKQLFADARTPAEYKAILGALGGSDNEQALQMALDQVSRQEVRAEAEVAVKRIANFLSGRAPDTAAKALEQISKSAAKQ